MIKTTWDPDELGLVIVKRLAGNELLVFCPYHDDKRPSAEYNWAKGVFYCFGCGEHKTAVELASDLGGSLIPMGTSEYSVRFEPETKEWLALLHGRHAMGHPYLRSRFVTDEQVARFNIKATSEGIVFPITDIFGETTGVQVRQFDREPKYMIHGRRQPLWPLHQVADIRRDVFITEGIFGALRADGAGLQAFALVGAGAAGQEDSIKAIHSIQKNVNSRGSQVYGVMDDDYAGLLAAGKLVLQGIPVILNAPALADEMSSLDWQGVARLASVSMTVDVMQVISHGSTSTDKSRLLSQLKKFYRRL